VNTEEQRKVFQDFPPFFYRLPATKPFFQQPYAGMNQVLRRLTPNQEKQASFQKHIRTSWELSTPAEHHRQNLITAELNNQHHNTTFLQDGKLHVPSRNRRPLSPRDSSWEGSPSPAQYHQRSSHRNKTMTQVHQQEIKPKLTINRHHRCSPQMTRHAQDGSYRDVSATQDRQRRHRSHGQLTEGSKTEMSDYNFKPQKQTQQRQTSRFDQPGLAGAMSTLAAGVSYVLQPHLHSEQKTSGALQRARRIYKGTNADVYRIGVRT
jgi:hypothetical protein